MHSCWYFFSLLLSSPFLSFPLLSSLFCSFLSLDKGRGINPTVHLNPSSFSRANSVARTAYLGQRFIKTALVLGHHIGLR